MSLPDHGRIDSADRKRRVGDRKCQYCQPNKGCNRNRNKQRPDRNKNHRRK